VRLSDLTGRRVALLGLGADVRAAVPAVVAAEPSQLVVVDEAPGSGPVVALDDVEVERVDLATAADLAEVFVRSPGFGRYRPELVAACDRGAAMTTPVDLWLGTHGPSRTVIGITGTKGKSTVTSILGALAEAAGVRLGVAGNLGPAVFGTGWDHDAPVVALEVSSYQAADLHSVPDVAVVTFLAEDHLSWHGGVETYTADKLRLIRNEGGTAGRILTPPPDRGGRAWGALEALGVAPEAVVAPPAPPLVPAHRVQNAALAAAALAAVGGPRLTDQEVVAAAGSSLPGRLDACAGPGEVLCVDDALASNPSATAAALAWLRELGRPTVVLLGGVERGVDPAPLVAEVARWDPDRLRAVALPESGEHLSATCGIAVLASAGEMDLAVTVALGWAPPDGVVLFSPAAATPPAQGNWETRSTAFRRALATHA
jgi:UDP-N-acetylmuramoylalanine--D-glutamate ligase